MCVAKRASVEINLFFLLLLFDRSFHLHSIVLVAYIDTICELSKHITFYFFFFLDGY